MQERTRRGSTREVAARRCGAAVSVTGCIPQVRADRAPRAPSAVADPAAPHRPAPRPPRRPTPLRIHLTQHGNDFGDCEYYCGGVTIGGMANVCTNLCVTRAESPRYCQHKILLAFKELLIYYNNILQKFRSSV